MIKDNEKIILFVGRLSKSKGAFSLFKAFSTILKTFVNCRLVAIGIKDSSIFDQIEFFDTKVTFTGHITSEELKKWYEAADIGIIPSYSEQCSYTGIEMMMYGLPIIASNGFGLRNMFVDNKNAKIADIKNIENSVFFEKEIVENLRFLLLSENIRQKLGKKARSVYEEKYEIKHMKTNYLNLLHNQI